MANKPLDDKAYQAEIEEKVRQMLDVEVKDAAPATPAQAREVRSAPELKDPLKSDDDSVGSPAVAPSSDDGDDAAETETQKNSEEPDPVDQETVELDKAVDDIVANESDELLAAEDEKLAAAFDNKKPKLLTRLKNAWHDWWHHPVKRRLTIGGLVAVLAIIFVAPPSRYFVMNTVGIRSGASLVILDESTQQPLRNVRVSLGSASGLTDKEGRVELSQLRLGRADLMIEKRAFAKLERSVTIGWGSNPLGSFKITPTGSQYTFMISDYLSGKPVEAVEATSGEASAVSNQQGELKLTLDVEDDQTTAEVIIKHEGYREETINLALDNQAETNVTLVPARKHIFVSKRSGTYDVYSISADGKNEVKVLSGSGNERDDLVLVPHPEKAYAALVSTRENARNQDGFLLSTLTLIDLSTNTPSKVAQSERIQIVDWIGDRLVYVQIAAGASAENPKRHRLMSYSLSDGDSQELAAANYFNDVLATGGAIFYAPSSAYTTKPVGFYKVSPDGTAQQTVHSSEVWNVYRTEYAKLVFAAAGQEWYEYGLDTGKASRLNGEPANLKSRVYANSPDQKRSLWIDQRDGKGVLLAYNVEDGADRVLHEQPGVGTPVQWLNNSAVVFRVSTSDETADYVMSLDGGKPKKLRDVTNTAGIDRWYYY